MLTARARAHTGDGVSKRIEGPGTACDGLPAAWSLLLAARRRINLGLHVASPLPQGAPVGEARAALVGLVRRLWASGATADRELTMTADNDGRQCRLTMANGEWLPTMSAQCLTMMT